MHDLGMLAFAHHLLVQRGIRWADSGVGPFFSQSLGREDPLHLLVGSLGSELMRSFRFITGHSDIMMMSDTHARHVTVGKIVRSSSTNEMDSVHPAAHCTVDNRHHASRT